MLIERNTEVHSLTDASVLVKAGKRPSGPNIRIQFRRDTRATRERRRFKTCKPLVARRTSEKKPKYIILLKYWRPVWCQIICICESFVWITNSAPHKRSTAAGDTRRLLEQDLLILPLFRAASTPQWLLRLMHKSGDIGPARTLRSSGAGAGLLTLAGVHLPDPGGDIRAPSEAAGATVASLHEEKRRFTSKNWEKIIKRGINNLACLLFK